MDAIIKASGVSNDISTAINEILGRLTLPPTPADGKCPHCGVDEFMIFEFGHERWSQTSADKDGDWFAVTNGWDDWSQAGHGEIFVCNGCDASFQPPVDVNWS